MPPKRRSGDESATSSKRAKSSRTSRSSASPAFQPLGRILALEPPINNLHETLKSTPDGLAVLSYYRTRGYLNHFMRDELCQRIIINELKSDLDHRINLKRYHEIVKEILELFPTESDVTWFLIEKSKNKTIVSGKLRNRFYNLRRHFIKVGLIAKSVLEDELLEDEDITDQLLALEDDDDLLWLYAHTQTYMQVSEMWDKTFEKRAILQQTMSINEYINKFACLKLPHGYEFLTREFDQSNPLSRDCMTESWPTVLKFLELELVKIPDAKDVLTACESEDEKLFHLLNNFAYLFKARTVPRGPGSKESWKPSRPEVQQSFFVHVKKHKDLKQVIDQRIEILNRLKLTIQPFVAVVGPVESIEQSLVVVDNIEWRADSPLHALDVCFKVFYSLGTVYPPEARHVWLFIQKCVYCCDVTFR